MKPGRNRQVVMRFFDAMSDNDRERVLSFFCDRSSFELSREQPVRGQEAIWEALMPWAGQQWRLENITETDDGAVMAERSARCMENGSLREVRYKGELKVSGSKIRRWRETRI